MSKTKFALEQPVKHLLVDLDGTLLGNRSLPLSIEFVRKSMAKLSAHTGWRKAAHTLLAINQEFRKSSRELTNDIRVVELFAKHMNLPLDEARLFLRESVQLIFPALQKHFYPMPGAKEFLEWAKDFYPLTLATNPVWPIEIIELRVKWAGLDPKIFGDITHIRKMHSCKPTLEYYEEILEQQKLKAEDCLLIGNDVKMDLPATRVGIRVFIVGKHKTVTPLKLARAKAPSWKGAFPALKLALEKHLQ